MTSKPKPKALGPNGPAMVTLILGSTLAAIVIVLFNLPALAALPVIFAVIIAAGVVQYRTNPASRKAPPK